MLVISAAGAWEDCRQAGQDPLAGSTVPHSRVFGYAHDNVRISQAELRAQLKDRDGWPRRLTAARRLAGDRVLEFAGEEPAWGANDKHRQLLKLNVYELVAAYCRLQQQKQQQDQQQPLGPGGHAPAAEGVVATPAAATAGPGHPAVLIGHVSDPCLAPLTIPVIPVAAAGPSGSAAAAPATNEPGGSAAHAHGQPGQLGPSPLRQQHMALVAQLEEEAQRPGFRRRLEDMVKVVSGGQ